MDESYVRKYPWLEQTHFWWVVRRERVVRMVDERYPPPSGAAVLDIGCGSGVTIEALSDRHAVAGIELDRDALRPGAPINEVIQLGDVMSIELPANHYDVVLMLDVLEHLDDPQSVLTSAGRALRPRGVLVVTVPAYRWLWSEHDELNHHRDRFTSGRLEELLLSAGYEVERLEYLFASLLPVKASLTGIERLFRRTVESAGDPGAVNRFALGWFRTEQRLARRLPRGLPFGTSVLAVAHRRDVSP